MGGGLERSGGEDEDGFQCRAATPERGIKDWDAEALATQQEPNDPQFPIFEAVDLRMGTVVEIHEGSGGDQLLAGSSGGRKPERNVRNLLGQRIDGAVHPNNVLGTV